MSKGRKGCGMTSSPQISSLLLYILNDYKQACNYNTEPCFIIPQGDHKTLAGQHHWQPS